MSGTWSRSSYSTIDGLLAAFFAVLIIIVIASGLWTTAEDKRQLVAVGGHDGYGELPPDEESAR